MTAAARHLRSIDGGKVRLPPALPEAIAFARALARYDAKRIMAGAMPDSADQQ